MIVSQCSTVVLASLFVTAMAMSQPPPKHDAHAGGKSGAASDAANGAGGYDPMKDLRRCEELTALATLRIQSAFVNNYVNAGGQLEKDGLLLRIPVGVAVDDLVKKGVKTLLTKMLKREPTEAELAKGFEDYGPRMIAHYSEFYGEEAKKIAKKISATELLKLLEKAGEADGEKKTDVNLKWVLATIRDPKIFDLEAASRLAEESKKAGFDKEDEKKPAKSLLNQLLATQKRLLTLESAAHFAHLQAISQEVQK